MYYLVAFINSEQVNPMVKIRLNIQILCFCFMSLSVSVNATIDAELATNECFKNGWDKSAYLELKNKSFELDDNKRTAVAMQLLECLLK